MVWACMSMKLSSHRGTLLARPDSHFSPQLGTLFVFVRNLHRPVRQRQRSVRQRQRHRPVRQGQGQRQGGKEGISNS